MRLADVFFQGGIGQAGPCEVLDPFSAARSEVWGRAQARLILQHLLSNVAYLEGEARFGVLTGSDRKDLAADLPDVRPTPLDHIGGCGEFPTESIEFFKSHIARRLSDRGSNFPPRRQRAQSSGFLSVACVQVYRGPSCSPKGESEIT